MKPVQNRLKCRRGRRLRALETTLRQSENRSADGFASLGVAAAAKRLIQQSCNCPQRTQDQQQARIGKAEAVQHQAAYPAPPSRLTRRRWIDRIGRDALLRVGVTFIKG